MLRYGCEGETTQFCISNALFISVGYLAIAIPHYMLNLLPSSSGYLAENATNSLYRGNASRKCNEILLLKTARSHRDISIKIGFAVVRGLFVTLFFFFFLVA